MPLNNPSVSPLTSSTATPSTVAAATTSSSLLAANAARKGGTIWNGGSGNLLIDFAATAVVGAYVAKLSPGGYYEIPFGYTGVISGIWDATGGSAFIRELT